MLVLSEAAAVGQWIAAYRTARLRIGFVPTMGALHAGHLALLAKARAECDRVVASVFVNPLQFGPREDFEQYPRPFARDAELCDRAGIDILYHGAVPDFYPDDFRTTVAVRELTETMCGRFRHGHFDGVCTVVAKLLARTSPDVAYFGQKDYQQAAVVTRMARDLDIPVEIRLVPTVREADGLALSSRNAYLGAEERRAAPCLWQGLSASVRLYERGERTAGVLRRACLEVIEGEPLAAVEYVEVADPRSLRPHGEWEAIGDRAVIAVAARIGKTRLIDNAILERT